MRSLLARLLIAASISVCGAPLTWALDEAAETASPFAVFSGFVTKLDATSVTVNKKGAGGWKMFRIDPKTKIEGKLKLNARVTVRYVADDAGVVAVKIIVR